MPRARLTGRSPAALALVSTLVLAGVLAFGVEWSPSYMPLATAGAALLSAVAFLAAARPFKTGSYVAVLASWAAGGIVSQILSPRWGPQQLLRL